MSGFSGMGMVEWQTGGMVEDKYFLKKKKDSTNELVTASHVAYQQRPLSVGQPNAIKLQPRL